MPRCPRHGLVGSPRDHAAPVDNRAADDEQRRRTAGTSLKNLALQRNMTLAKPFTADRDGFSLNAAVACQPHPRERLERLCRYVTRPAICPDRLSCDTNGKVVPQLKRPYRDGTTHTVFGPGECLARPAALVARPRANLTRYHGAFAPNCKLPTAVVPTPNNTTPGRRSTACQGGSDRAAPAAGPDTPAQAPLTWAQRRVTDHSSACP